MNFLQVLFSPLRTSRMLRDAKSRATEAENLAVSLGQRLEDAKNEIHVLQTLRDENEKLASKLASQDIEIKKQKRIISKLNIQEQRIQDIDNAICHLQGIKSIYDSKIHSLQNEITDYRKAIRRLTVETGDELEIIDFKSISPEVRTYTHHPASQKQHPELPPPSTEESADDSDWFSPLQI